MTILTIKSDIGQHSQFLQCFRWEVRRCKGKTSICNIVSFFGTFYFIFLYMFNYILHSHLGDSFAVICSYVKVMWLKRLILSPQKVSWCGLHCCLKRGGFCGWDLCHLASSDRGVLWLSFVLKRVSFCG